LKPIAAVKSTIALLRWLTRERGGLFGINARSLGPARIVVGDAVELL